MSDAKEHQALAIHLLSNNTFFKYLCMENTITLQAPDYLHVILVNGNNMLFAIL